MSSTERMILGNNCIYSGNPKETGLNRNVLIVGGTGSGKTVSFVEPALMEALRVTKPNNKIVILTKRDLADKYMLLYKTAGFTSSIRNSMRTKPSINFNKFTSEKSILFITTSPVKKALHGLANIFVSQAISELFTIADESETGVLPIPVDSAAVRHYIDRGCKLYHIPHITCGTGTIGDQFTGNVVSFPADSVVDLEYVWGNGYRQTLEERRSCSDIPDETQAQVMGFSAQIAGMTMDLALNYLLGKSEDVKTASAVSTVSYLFGSISFL